MFGYADQANVIQDGAGGMVISGVFGTGKMRYLVRLHKISCANLFLIFKILSGVFIGLKTRALPE